MNKKSVLEKTGYMVNKGEYIMAEGLRFFNYGL
jgi:hypothetical protein